MSKVRAELRIEGLVQGVFFRQSTRQTAIELGITGWARNCPDGSVEVVFEGDEESLIKAITWCRQGPPSARVSDVIVKWCDFLDEFRGFEIRR